MGRAYEVTVLGKSGKGIIYSAEFQGTKEWKAILLAARGSRAEVHCGCPGSGTKRLAIRHYSESDTCSLARFPLSHGQHAVDCRFYAADPATSGRSSYVPGVVQALPDGKLKVRLGIGLDKQKPVARAPDDGEDFVHPESQERRPASQRAMSLLGLLHLLWSEADLNIWRPGMAGKRNIERIHWWLNKAAEGIIAGRKKLDAVLLAGTSLDGQSADRNQKRAEDALASHARLLVIAPLATYGAEKEPGFRRRLLINGFKGIPHLEMVENLWGATERSFAIALSAWRQGARVMAIAQIEVDKPKGKIQALVLDLALMQVTANWIPVESSYECLIADRLTAEERAFDKPLRYDAGASDVFPDFILLDTEKPAPMEVFGRNDEAYDARKAEKTEYYRKHFGLTGWWAWNAVADQGHQSIPPFPAKRTTW